MPFPVSTTGESAWSRSSRSRASCRSAKKARFCALTRLVIIVTTATRPRRSIDQLMLRSARLDATVQLAARPPRPNETRRPGTGRCAHDTSTKCVHRRTGCPRHRPAGDYQRTGHDAGGPGTISRVSPSWMPNTPPQSSSPKMRSQVPRQTPAVALDRYTVHTDDVTWSVKATARAVHKTPATERRDGGKQHRRPRRCERRGPLRPAAATPRHDHRELSDRTVAETAGTQRGPGTRQHQERIAKHGRRRAGGAAKEDRSTLHRRSMMGPSVWAEIPGRRPASDHRMRDPFRAALRLVTISPSPIIDSYRSGDLWHF